MKIIVNGIATEYEDIGQGPVVLFLHGWKDTLKTFDAATSLLSDMYRIVRLDLPGFGATEAPTDIWTIADYSAFVAHFIKKTSIDIHYLVGHSFGGRISIQAVATGILEPKKLVLIATAGIKKTDSLRNLSFKVIAKIGKVITAIPPLTMFRNSLKKKLYARSGSDYLSAGNLKETYLKVINEDLSSYAADISIPTLLLWGDLDTQTPVADGIYFSKLIKESKLIIFENKGHFVHQEAVAEIASAIKNFCQ